MPINTKFEIKEKYVLITSEGERNNFAAVIEGTNLMYEIIEKTQCSLVLLDYRKVIFNVPQTDAFNIIRLYELKMPRLTNIRIAAWLANLNPGFTTVWKDVAKSKGFQFETFLNLKDAEEWLLIKP